MLSDGILLPLSYLISSLGHNCYLINQQYDIMAAQVEQVQEPLVCRVSCYVARVY
jgi:catabolite regulation protein CreA